METKMAEQMEAAGHEMKMNPPKVLAQTLRKKGPKMANKQRVAIMFSKARTALRKRGRKK